MTINHRVLFLLIISHKDEKCDGFIPSGNSQLGFRVACGVIYAPPASASVTSPELTVEPEEVVDV
jgi:hypothetical protein